MSFSKKINWLNAIFFVTTPLVGIGGLIYLGVTGGYHGLTWLLMFLLMCAAGFSITTGYHRLFSHRSYKAAWPVRLLLVLFGSAAFQGSVLEWCTDHRNHHLYTDTDKDPYSIKKGFWYAHIGWLFVLDPTKRDFSNVSELAEDPIIRFQHKYFPTVATVMGFIFPMLVAGLGWGDWLGGLLIAGVFRLVLNHHATFAINSVCHVFGARTYSDKQSARDNWVTALLTYGEGYHNFHHQFPLDYRNGIRFYQYDPTKWIIKGLSWCGLASDLKQVDEERILKYRLRMEEARMMQKVAACPENLMGQLTDYIKPMYEQLLQKLDSLHQLEKSYKDLKRQKLDDCLKAHRLRLRLARAEWKRSLDMWREVVKSDLQSLALLPTLG